VRSSSSRASVRRRKFSHVALFPTYRVFHSVRSDAATRAPLSVVSFISPFAPQMNGSVRVSLHFDRPTVAWNIDGSEGARPESHSSWIELIKETTKRACGTCAFDGCVRDAEVGGHLWIAERKTVVVAAICRMCNSPRNMARRQGSNAKVRRGASAVEVPYTEEMRHAERRFGSPRESPVKERLVRRNSGGSHVSPRKALDFSRRQCETCDESISHRPLNHAMCLDCYRSENGSGSPSSRGHRGGRRCDVCSSDISDRPLNHAMCLDCYHNGARARAGTGVPNQRICCVCSIDITDRPPNQAMCYSCYKSVQMIPNDW